MVNDEGSPQDSPEQRADIARRRDALLAAARGEGGDRGASGSRLAGLGIQFVLAILFCLYVGMWLDRKLGTAPWLLLTGTLVGALVGFYALYRAMVAEDRRLDAEEGPLPKGDGKR